MGKKKFGLVFTSGETKQKNEQMTIGRQTSNHDKSRRREQWASGENPLYNYITTTW
jgi:hypothetical protein